MLLAVWGPLEQARLKLGPLKKEKRSRREKAIVRAAWVLACHTHTMYEL
jgi:hypothetical protein